jgi:hypothetical protein
MFRCFETLFTDTPFSPTKSYDISRIRNTLWFISVDWDFVSKLRPSPTCLFFIPPDIGVWRDTVG